MRVDLSNQIALVTGAAANIGKAIADTLARNGARVIYADVNIDGARTAASSFPGCSAVALDITDTPRVHEVIARIASEHNRLDLLVNNAGANSRNRVTVDEYPQADWDRMLAVDLSGVFACTQAAARVMKARKSGRIINISSVLGLVAARLQCGFNAAKAGVVSLTQSTAIELGAFGILCNAIAPGSILTDATKDLFYGKDPQFRDGAAALLAHIPLGHPGDVQDIANAALFLAAPESAYITGQVLAVDGGWTAGYIRDF
ncbi:MAG TPA: SDR family NAD(P)-dependent oxidoreductase [Tepidisphaeraceae bacterium]|jgi:NAD(P)-dependent dehydrogenase (short-subunit alcohol dehydrogenase family)